jgi:hypothetical protein
MKYFKFEVEIRERNTDFWDGVKEKDAVEVIREVEGQLLNIIAIAFGNTPDAVKLKEYRYK